MADFSAFDLGEGAAQAAAPSDKLDRLREKIRAQIAQEEMVAQIEDDLKAANKTLAEMRTREIPDFMMELQIPSLTVDGKEVTIEDMVTGSLPSKDLEKRAKALAYMEAHPDGRGLIRNVISVTFSRSQHNVALELLARLQEEGHTVELKSDIHHSTLAAFGRSNLEAGRELEFETIGLYHQKISKITEVKKKGGKK